MAKVIEIPRGKRTFRYRFFEILPFAISVTMVALLPIWSWVSSVTGAIYLLLIVVTNLVKAVGIARISVWMKMALRCSWKSRESRPEQPEK